MANVKFTDLANLGNITANTIVPVVEANVNYTVTAGNLQTFATTNAGQITANGVSATGNIVAGAFFVGDGSQITNLPVNYSNANVAAYLPTYSGNISANYYFGNGSQLTGLPATYSNANVAAYLPTYSGNITATVISASGNVTASFLLGNISAATGGYGNSDVQAVLQTYTGTLTAGSLTTTGNIAGNFFVGNGSQLTGITSSLSGNLAGNINGNTFSITNLANLSATGNISGGNITGNGSQLTGIPTSIIAGTGISVTAATGAVTITNNNPNPYSNANVAAYLPTYTGNIAAGNVSATGTITGTHAGNGAGLSNIVTSITAGSGISINASTGAVTITATGSGGGGTSIANGNSNVSIANAGGNITSAIGGWGNVMNIYSTTNYPIHRPKGFLLVDSTTGSYNNSFPFDGGLQTTGACSLAGQTITDQGFFGTVRGGVNTTNSVTATGGVNSGSGGFSANQRTVAQGTTGTAGQIFWDANYIYVCTATNTWKRAALTTY
jgi:hypothetical protein